MIGAQTRESSTAASVRMRRPSLGVNAAAPQRGASAAQGLNEFYRLAAIELCAKERDVGLDRIGNHVAVDAPHEIEQFGARQDLLGAFGEDEQQIELARGELDPPISR